MVCQVSQLERRDLNEHHLCQYHTGTVTDIAFSSKQHPMQGGSYVWISNVYCADPKRRKRHRLSPLPFFADYLNRNNLRGVASTHKKQCSDFGKGCRYSVFSHQGDDGDMVEPHHLAQPSRCTHRCDANAVRLCRNFHVIHKGSPQHYHVPLHRFHTNLAKSTGERSSQRVHLCVPSG